MNVHERNSRDMERVKTELEKLDHEMIEVNGKIMKPSQCYRFETTPLHVLYNTNCPDNIRNKIEEILEKYLGRENRTQQP